MSGQSWSKREAPWGSRRSYVGGALSDISLAGPGMDASKPAFRQPVSEAAVQAEQAALMGLTAEELRARADAVPGTRLSGSMVAAVQCYECGGHGHMARECQSRRERNKRHKVADEQGQRNRDWFYIDTDGTEQGPFDTPQMLARYGDDDGVGGGRSLLPTTMVKRGKSGILQHATRFFVRIRDPNDRQRWTAKELSSSLATNRLGCVTEQQTQHSSVPESPATAQERSTNQLYVGGLPRGTGGAALRTLFEGFGSLTDAWAPGEGREGGSRGFGFVSFSSASDAAKAVEAMNESMYEGWTLRVSFAKGARAGNNQNDPVGNQQFLAQTTQDGSYGEHDVSLGSWTEMIDNIGRRK